MAKENPRFFRLERTAKRVEQRGRPPGMEVEEKGATPDKDVLRDFTGLRWSRGSVAYNLRGGNIVFGRGNGKGLGVKMRPMTSRESRR